MSKHFAEPWTKDLYQAVTTLARHPFAGILVALVFLLGIAISILR
jgi:hypothetical protein